MYMYMHAIVAFSNVFVLLECVHTNLYVHTHLTLCVMYHCSSNITTSSAETAGELTSVEVIVINTYCTSRVVLNSKLSSKWILKIHWWLHAYLYVNHGMLVTIKH